jgi:Tfp pilus assembly protein PilW
MTLVEMLVSIALGAVVLTAFAQMLFYAGRSFAAMSNYTDLDYGSNHALKVMSREIRQANLVQGVTSTNLTLVDYDTLPLEYSWSSGAKTLSRTKNGQTEVLLRDCETVNFALITRNPMNGAFDYYPVSTNPTPAKLVQVSWVCRRRVLGTAVNTLSELSAKFVLRNQ